MHTVKLFLASSQELKDDREAFRNFISVENDRLYKQGMRIELVQWENFLDAISDTGLQSEYNKALCNCHMAIFLFFTKVGKYTAEEFDTAYGAFKETGRPMIWTYFKNAPVNPVFITDEIQSLLAFKKKVDELEHFASYYDNMDGLMYKFRNQLDMALPQITEGHSPPPDDGGRQAQNPVPAPTVVLNQVLTRRLLEAMQAYNERARRLAANAGRIAPDWETQSRFADPAKELIATKYPGVLGIQLRKLMAIGKEKASTNKYRKYLEASVLAGKRAVQLLCFVLLSKLWDAKKEPGLQFTPEEEALVRNFFDDEFEWGIDGFASLLQTLVQIFRSNGLPFPLPELEALQPQLRPDGEFLTACSQLSAITANPEASGGDCLRAEGMLTTVLEALSFLVNYGMVSIRAIGYFETRNRKPYYLYNSTALGVDSKVNVNQEQFTYAEAPTTDAVLLYGENQGQRINLYPFVIDANALAFEGGAKIYFYACRNYADDNLQYQFVEDNSAIGIGNTKTLRSGTDMAEVVTDAASRRALRFDAVHALFHEAKKALVGEE